MNRRFVLLTALILAALALPASGPAYADGIIVPEPPICDPAPCPHPIPVWQLAIQYHHVEVTIEDQVAITHVDQVFRNENDWSVEGTYIFPLPHGAAVTSFTLWIDGEPVEGKVLTREEARATYEDIVRSLRDPALLEYVDRGAVQASIFPIDPGDTRRIELEYTQVLAADNDLIRYSYPLNTEKFSSQPLEEVSISMEVRSPDPVRAVYSPSHNVAILREGDYAFEVGYEAFDVTPDKDFELFYSIAREGIGLNLLSYRDPESDDPDGFFLLLAAPSVEMDPDQSIAKDLLLVLDQSGSMEGEKFRQAQAALRFVLEHLNPEDRFNVLAFSTGIRPFSNRLRPADEAQEAIRWVDSLAAAGSTDINRALLEALDQADPERPTFVIFLTDGLPTEGVTEVQAILDNVQAAAPANLSLFAFGVGYDVDTFLLDSLAENHHGATTYVTPGQAIDEAVSGFYAKVSTPVLTNIELEFGDVVAYDLYPDPLPDLFAGGQLVLVGRYRSPGTETIRLSGTVNGERQVFSYRDQRFRASGGSEFLPRLWATRKIGALLNLIRLQGPEQELVDQVVKLSIRYGIVTPYTSYLVTEPFALGEEAQADIAERAFSEILATPTVTTGKEAVERAANEGMISQAEVAVAPPSEVRDVVRVIGPRTFRLVDGIWIDTAVDPDQATVVRVPFLSEDYFTLVDASAELGAAFALGQQVIVSVGGVTYQVVDADESGDPLQFPQVQPEVADPDPIVDVEPEAESQPAEGQSSRSLPCASILPILGLAGFPLARRRARLGSS